MGREWQREQKKIMMNVFKDIVIGFKEILEEAPTEDRNNREIRSMKIIYDKLEKGSMSFSKTQKGLIKRSIDAYLDEEFAEDPDLELQVTIAKQLQEKYNKE